MRVASAHPPAARRRGRLRTRPPRGARGAVAAIRAAGARRWTIWRSGLELFHVVECEDYAPAAGRARRPPGEHRLAGADGRAARRRPRLRGGGRRRRPARRLGALTRLQTRTLGRQRRADHDAWPSAARRSAACSRRSATTRRARRRRRRLGRRHPHVRHRAALRRRARRAPRSAPRCATARATSTASPRRSAACSCRTARPGEHADIFAEPPTSSARSTISRDGVRRSLESTASSGWASTASTSSSSTTRTTTRPGDRRGVPRARASCATRASSARSAPA